ncbi:MAG: hypothetical protein ABIH69_02685 [bacterium]
MSGETVDRRNYDVVSLSQAGKDKRANHVQSALEYDYTKVSKPGQFFSVLQNTFLRKEPGSRACC